MLNNKNKTVQEFDCYMIITTTGDYEYYCCVCGLRRTAFFCLFVAVVKK